MNIPDNLEGLAGMGCGGSDGGGGCSGGCGSCDYGQHIK